MFNLIKKFLQKKEKVTPKFNSYFLIRKSDLAAQNGLNYDFNKVVDIYKDGKKETEPYSPDLIEALEEIDQIPGTNKIENDEDWEFDDVTSFGFIEEER